MRNCGSAGHATEGSFACLLVQSVSERHEEQKRARLHARALACACGRHGLLSLGTCKPGCGGDLRLIAEHNGVNAKPRFLVAV
eukprot:593652-Pleurochrysis_carterae.AAC.1